MVSTCMLGGLYLLAEHLVQKLKGEVERLWGRGEGAVMSTCMQGEVHIRFEGRVPGSCSKRI